MSWLLQISVKLQNLNFFFLQLIFIFSSAQKNMRCFFSYRMDKYFKIKVSIGGILLIYLFSNKEAMPTWDNVIIEVCERNKNMTQDFFRFIIYIIESSSTKKAYCKSGLSTLSANRGVSQLLSLNTGRHFSHDWKHAQYYHIVPVRTS